MKLPFTPDFFGKVAVVTGGAGILCSNMCEALAQCGAKVAILNRTESKAHALAEKICQNGGIAKGYPVDILDKDSLEHVHQKILTELGPCEILLNGVGGNHRMANTCDERFDPASLDDPDRISFFDLPPESINYVFDVNMTSILLSTQCFARDMVYKSGGVILNISSMAAYSPLTKTPAYCAAKAAVSNFTQWLAVHFVNSGIRVNAIAPGFFSTVQNKSLLFTEDGTPAPRTQNILNGTPMHRFGAPEELLGAMLWLVDNNCSSFVTGVILPVDGGFSAFNGV